MSRHSLYKPPLPLKRIRKYPPPKFKPYKKNGKVRIYTQEEIDKYCKQNNLERKKL